VTATEARSRAHARFGPVALAADECRGARDLTGRARPRRSQLAVQTLLDRLDSIDPTVGTSLEKTGHEGTMRWVTRMESYLLRLAFWLTVVLGALALALTLSGLFSVLSYLVRTAHQGNRRAHGARCHHARCHAAGPGVVDPARRLGLLFGGGAAATLAALLPATRAAHLDPTRALRED